MEIKNFLSDLINNYPSKFIHKVVIDHGSCGENYSDVFKDISEYITCDISDSNSPCFNCYLHEIRGKAMDKTPIFDVVLSINTLQNDMYYRESLSVIPDLIYKDGLFITAFHVYFLNIFIAHAHLQAHYSFFKMYLEDDTVYFYGIKK